MAKNIQKPKSTPTPAVDNTAAPSPAASTLRSAPKSASFQKTFLFDKTNYKWMIGGVVLIIIGFMLMSGGKSDNPHEFHYDQIYSFRRVTLAPLTVLLGFAIEFYAIMRKPGMK